MATSKDTMLEMDPKEMFGWDVANLDAGLKELNITVGMDWNKQRKAYELCKGLEQLKEVNVKANASQDSNVVMMQMFQMMQKQMSEDRAIMAEQMQAMAEKIGGGQEATPRVGAGGSGNKSRAKGKHPEKLDRDIDYATFLQWEKSWNLYVISDQLDTLSDPQKTAIFFSLFTKELLSDMQYRFKIDIDADQKVEEVIAKIKEYLKGQRSMVLARYHL